MIRIISVRKALLAGIAGAITCELVLRLFALAGLPLVDLVGILGALAAPGPLTWASWSLGFVMHLGVGALGAVFYAYFIWSLRPWRPVFQGLAFGLLGAVVVTIAVYPLLLTMHAASGVLHTTLWGLQDRVSWRERAGLLLGHLIYGATLGALYTRPVGYPAGQTPRPWARRRHRAAKAGRIRAASDSAFIFATGIECSYPTLEGGRWRLDQMEATGHYRRWREDLALTADSGITHLRYGPPLHLVCLGPGRYDWAFIDEVMAEMRTIGLTPIIDLCHFGLPAWLENFQNAETPNALCEYARAFAGRYPWVRYYTPVNEMYVCAKLSALEGLWNEQCRDERSFLTAVRHLAKANILMMHAILAERCDAVFVHSESGEFFQACCPGSKVVHRAAFENERRFLPLDLLYAHPVSEGMHQHLRDHGMPSEEYAWFMNQATPRRTILGVDYYQWNEKLIDSDGNPQALGELFGWYVIAQQYYDRYRLPMMHTETNTMDARDAPHWLWRQWHNVNLVRQAGMPVVGFTWYSLTDQVDWDIAQSQALGNVNPVGMFDLNRDPRPVAQAYKHLIHTFGDEPGIGDCPPLKAILEGREARR
jgi:beta-glucosidase/6-phospho-beta-glucosidase/beta-galactosidase